MKRALSFLILACGLATLIPVSSFAADTKIPKLVLKVFDQDSKRPITSYTPTIRRLSTNEKNGDAFIFRIENTSAGYNPYTTTIDVPWAFRDKNYPVTNWMVSLNSTNIRGRSDVKVKETNINISGIIKNEAGLPLPNVLVRCLDESQNVIKESITGDDGSYSFIDLPPKKYIIKTTSSRNSFGKDVSLPALTAPSVPLKTELPPVMESNATPVPPPATLPKTSFFPKLTKDSVTIVSALNGTLVLRWKKTDPMTGILVAIKLFGVTTYITPANELFENPSNNAYNADEIILNSRNIQTNGHPLFRDGVPFDLILYPVYSSSIYSTEGFPLKRIVTRNSVPPPLPVLESVTVVDRKLNVRWHPATHGEMLAYKIYTRESDQLKLLDYIETYSSNYYMEKDIVLPPSYQEAANIYITVTAVDLSKNESDFREKETSVEPSAKGNTITQDIILEKGDLPPAEFPKKAIPKGVYRPAPAHLFDVGSFIANGYHVPAGKFLKIKNRDLVIPQGRRITVGESAVLALDNVSIRAATNSNWFGMECRRGSILEMRNSRLSGAETGISAGEGSKVFLSGSSVSRCATGLSAHSASVILEGSRLWKNSRAADISYSTVVLRKNSSIVSNGRNFNAAFSVLSMMDSSSTFNRSSFYLLNCPPATIRGSSFLANGGEGLLLDNTPAFISGSAFRYNLRNGILCANGSNPIIDASDLTENGFYAIRNGGRLSNCFISRNNHADGIDNTPNNGADDGALFTFSNMTVQQIYAADSVKGLRATPSIKQEARP